MRVWYPSLVLASAVLLGAGFPAVAQIRETVPLSAAHPPQGALAERPNHPVVLLHTRAGEFTGADQTVAQFMLKQIDPVKAVETVSPPKGIDGIIAYPGSRMLMVRGSREAVAGYRASLEKADREAPARGPREPAGGPGERAVSPEQPVILLPTREKLQIKADHVETKGESLQATGNVVLRLANGIELRARRVRITRSGGQQRIEIER